MEDIDWDELRRSRYYGSRKQSSRNDWDKRAANFKDRTRDLSYISQFISLMKPRKNWRVLDVGSGPGTLALPLAPLVSRITALDFSEKMLCMLRDSAANDNITNITTRQLAWEDNWDEDISPHSVAIASRSLNLPFLRAALEKLSRYALEWVFITDRVGSGPHDPAAFAALGRALPPGPDYTYTLKILKQMGYHPSTDFIKDDTERLFPSFEQAYRSFCWMFPEMTGEEKIRLRDHVGSICRLHSDGSVTMQREHRTTWAFISWRPSFSTNVRRPCNNSRNDL